MTNSPAHMSPGVDSPYWRGAVDWVREGQWWQPWRLLPGRAAHAHAPRLLEVARMPAGARAEMRTDATVARLPIEYLEEADGQVDVIVDGDLHSRINLAMGGTRLEVSLPRGMKDLQIWLPHAGITRVGALDLPDATTIEPLPNRVRWTTYGSSITLCSAAPGPSRTWPSLVARELGWDLTCLGFSGEAHLDPIAARTIAATPADVVSLCLGINIYGFATFNERSFAPQISGFIEAAREAHAGVPIVVITPIASPEREHTTNSAGLTLAKMRRTIAEVVDVLATQDEQLHLVDGLQILGTHEAHLLPDGLHPDGVGYELMAERLGPILGGLNVSASA